MVPVLCLQDDNIMLHYVNDANRIVYAFEMSPCPVITIEIQDPPKILDFCSLRDESKEFASQTTCDSGKVKFPDWALFFMLSKRINLMTVKR